MIIYEGREDKQEGEGSGGEGERMLESDREEEDLDERKAIVKKEDVDEGEESVQRLEARMS